MIKHHKVEVIFSTESEIYQRIEGVAARTGASVETVLELLLNKALLQHVENNIGWAEALTKECFEAFEEVPDSASADDLSDEEIDKLFETVPAGTVFTGTGYIPESGMILRVQEEQEEPKGIQVKYVEPADYIPEDLRKKYKLGEYAED